MAKIAISLPDDVLEHVESERMSLGETRSEFFRRAVEMYFKNQRKQKDIEQYIRGYQQYPETEEEIGQSRAYLGMLWGDSPWEEGAEQ